ncbi:MAG: hypothetical protein ABMB14_41345 [Myxococcota bacterium]
MVRTAWVLAVVAGCGGESLGPFGRVQDAYLVLGCPDADGNPSGWGQVAARTKTCDDPTDDAGFPSGAAGDDPCDGLRAIAIALDTCPDGLSNSRSDTLSFSLGPVGDPADLSGLVGSDLAIASCYGADPEDSVSEAVAGTATLGSDDGGDEIEVQFDSDAATGAIAFQVCR